MGFKLGQLVIELAANTARLQQDLGKAVTMAEGAAAKFKSAFSFVGAGVGGGLLGAALIGAAKNAIEFGDNINKAAIKAGIGGKAMSELAYAAKLADVDIGSLSVAIKKMQVAISEAGTGSKQAQGALDALGLTVDQLQKRRPEQQFELIADRISKLEDPADRARAATELFGKAGADLLPMFSQGAQGIEKALQEARKLGLSFSDDQLNTLSTADDSIKRLSASWSGFATTLTAEVAPALSGILDKLSGIDTRSQEQKIKALTDDIQARRGFGLGGGVGGRSAADEAAANQELANMRGMQQLEQIRGLQTGTSGGPQNRRDFGAAIGFARADAEAAAAAARDKAQAEYEKQAEDIGNFAEKISQESQDIWTKENAQRLEDWTDTEVKQFEIAQEFADKQKQIEEDVARWRESQISATAQFFKDSFLQAFDDWINTGKFKFGQLLKYMVAEWARAQIANLFKGGGSDSGSSGGGFLSALGSAIGSMFGGGSTDAGSVDGRASGGSVMGGRTYLIGERGPELLHMGASGSITPNSALGSGGTVTNHITFNLVGDQNQNQRAIAEALRQNNDDLERRGLLAKAA